MYITVPALTTQPGHWCACVRVYVSVCIYKYIHMYLSNVVRAMLAGSFPRQGLIKPDTREPSTHRGRQPGLGYSLSESVGHKGYTSHSVAQARTNCPCFRWAHSRCAPWRPQYVCIQVSPSTTTGLLSDRKKLIKTSGAMCSR